MAGHSKWANIKHKKAKSDEKRGKEFTKIAREITIAVRTGGGGDPDANPKLKLAIQKAKAINMPNDNINRAIKKGTGELESEVLEEIVYEGYAPGGVAVMLEIATDNRNRTASEIRHYFSKNNGNLGESGCVAWMFNRVGLISISRENVSMDEEEFMLKALELGAEDVRDEGEQYDIVTSVDTFMEIKENLEKEGFIIDEADIVLLPENTVEINDVEVASRIIKLIEMLEDHDDVQNVYTNMSLTDEVVEKLS
ncbi:MAG: YebC/PmpR family DNA-binding transcriptional regulator [Syntrophomonadaceae bacterium]|jgi:YebC/PmpR family DNA-binding regulatory protein|nr:YebC/PmpR family DNA-binding transcriptional regulator [Bacillota bacterium]NLM88975.1 YebC/PmpR family DNA-binding transcriptional regulator [Syntrophomonadaceae bacterium]HAA09326.1 YebC/PmpR family DNA-binding transcriptional regulator [Syntrophomonas sp.]HQA49870.1 YebC/PmpR family DNA-binding transcriptional regulator [Syntrophomonadaceae bacterium]HQD89704.1 YebC/PmpR family DNA-binding transcriptional regulator [Syntrophomonadaceae bacterium]